MQQTLLYATENTLLQLNLIAYWTLKASAIRVKHFDKYLNKLSQSGIDVRLQNVFYSFEDHLNCKSDYEEVGMDIAMFLFRLLGVGLALSLVALLIEAIYSLMTKKWILFYWEIDYQKCTQTLYICHTLYHMLHLKTYWVKVALIEK